MNDPAVRGPGAWGVLGVALALIACGAGGFLLHRLTRPHATLYPAAAPPAPPPQGQSPPRPAQTIPETLPDFALPSPDGTIHLLSEWRGRPLLINFWATWCEPCRREIPLLTRLRHERSAEHLEVVGIAVDEAGAVRKYAAERGIDYPVLVGEEGGLAAVGAFGMDTVLPFTVFADRTGRVVTVKTGELHRDEADFILDRLREVDRGTLALPAAREAISTGIARLAAARSAPTAAH